MYVCKEPTEFEEGKSSLLRDDKIGIPRIEIPNDTSRKCNENVWHDHLYCLVKNWARDFRKSWENASYVSKKNNFKATS